jgi:sugar phosphate isomerase/epimerase
MYRDRLGDWVETAKKSKVVVAIKPHRGGFALNLPEHAVWLIEQLKKSPWLRIVYDYSHYDLRGLTVKQTIETVAPYLALVAVKDVEKRDGKEVFLLPGESGRIDYVELFRTLHKVGYRGDVSCEVSVMVSSRAGYDPVAAARACYAKMAPAMEKAGVRKRG